MEDDQAPVGERPTARKLLEEFEQIDWDAQTDLLLQASGATGDNFWFR